VAPPFRDVVSVRDFCSDVYAAWAEARKDLAKASGVMVGILFRWSKAGLDCQNFDVPVALVILGVSVIALFRAERLPLFLPGGPDLGIVSRPADGAVPFVVVRQNGYIAVHSPKLSPCELAGQRSRGVPVRIKNIHPFIVFRVGRLEAAVFRIDRRSRARAAFPNAVQPGGVAAEGPRVAAPAAGIAVAIAGVI